MNPNPIDIPVDISIDISVAIVSYNTRELLRECLLSLGERADEAAMEIIVVDNGSRDGSAEMVSREFPDVRLIEARANLGFGRANNLALQEARGEYLWILNSDTSIEPGSIRAMLGWMRDHSGCGAIGARLILRDGSTQMSFALDPSLWAVFCEQTYISRLGVAHPLLGSIAIDADLDEPQLVPQVCGASLLVRRQAWRQVGGFDPAFFMYFEDTDLCVRIREAGWQVWYLPGARVRHHLGASSAGDWRARSSMVASYNAGRLHFFSGRRGPRVGQRLRAVLLGGALLRLMIWSALALVPGKRRSARDQVLLFRRVWRATRRAPLRFGDGP